MLAAAQEAAAEARAEANDARTAAATATAAQQAAAEEVPADTAEEMAQLQRHAKWAAQAALDAEKRIKELERQLATQVRGRENTDSDHIRHVLLSQYDMWVSGHAELQAPLM